MAYVPILDEWIEAGKPTKEEIFQYLKANQEYFNTSIDALSQTATFSLYNLTVGGSVNQYTTAQINARFPIFRAPVNAEINDIRITLLATSSSGNLTLQVERSTNDGVSWNPLLTGSGTTLTGTAVGSQNGAVTFIAIDSGIFQQGDLFRIVLNSIKSTQGQFHVNITAEVA
jgi:hypothetical protein